MIDGSESTSQNCDYRFTVPDVASFRIEVDVIDASGADSLRHGSAVPPPSVREAWGNAFFLKLTALAASGG